MRVEVIPMNHGTGREFLKTLSLDFLPVSEHSVPYEADSIDA